MDMNIADKPYGAGGDVAKCQQAAHAGIIAVFRFSGFLVSGVAMGFICTRKPNRVSRNPRKKKPPIAGGFHGHHRQVKKIPECEKE